MHKVRLHRVFPRLRRIEFVLCAIGAWLHAAPARAEDPDPQQSSEAQAAIFIEQGELILHDGHIWGACRFFEESLLAAESYNARLRLAQCLSILGTPGRAAMELDRLRVDIALDRARAAHGTRARSLDAIEKRAAMLAQALLPKLDELPRIKVALSKVVKSTPELTVSIDGARCDLAAVEEGIPVDPGNHVVTLEAPQRKEITLQVQVFVVPQEIRVTDPMEPVPAKPPPPPPPPTDPKPADPPPLKTAAVPAPAREPPPAEVGPKLLVGAGLAAGLVGFGVGIGYGVAFLKAKQRYIDLCIRPDTCEDGRENQRSYDETMSLLIPEAIGFVVGGVGLGVAGLTALFLSPSQTGSTSLQISPAIGPDHATIGFTGHF